MHQWGDKDVDWAGIEAAAQYIGDFCSRWARLGGQTKEKYGTVRFYAKWTQYSVLHDLIWPGYYYVKYPKWLHWFDMKYFSPAVMKLFGWAIFGWQKFIYSIAYRRACKKWPHIQKEILSCCDAPTFIKGHFRIEENTEEKMTHILDLSGNIISTWVTLKKHES